MVGLGEVLHVDVRGHAAVGRRRALVDLAHALRVGMRQHPVVHRAHEHVVVALVQPGDRLDGLGLRLLAGQRAAGLLLVVALHDADAQLGELEDLLFAAVAQVLAQGLQPHAADEDDAQQGRGNDGEDAVAQCHRGLQNSPHGRADRRSAMARTARGTARISLPCHIAFDVRTQVRAMSSGTESKPGNTLASLLSGRPRLRMQTPASTWRKSVVTARSRPSLSADASMPGQRP